MFIHWSLVACLVLNFPSLARNDDSEATWKGSKCDFTNHRHECIPCSVTAVRPRSDNPDSEEPRAPPEKPREVDAFLYKNEDNVSKSWEYEGIRFIIKHPFTPITLSGYFIEIDMSRMSDGVWLNAPPYHLNVTFKEVHYDDPSIKVDIPLSSIFDILGDENPSQWLERTLKLTVCSMPALKSWEKGNCFQPKKGKLFLPARNLPVFNQTYSNKFATPCEHEETSRANTETNSPTDNGPSFPISPFRLAMIALVVLFFLFVLILFGFAWLQIKNKGKIKALGLVLIKEPPPSNPNPSPDHASCTKCGQGELNVTNRQGSRSISTWESGADIHHWLGRNAVAASGNGGFKTGGVIPDNSGFVQHYKFDNTSLDLVHEQQMPHMNMQRAETCDGDTYDSASGSFVSRASAYYVDHSSPV